jgi:[protein-PII] uridylyltransferase
MHAAQQNPVMSVEEVLERLRAGADAAEICAELAARTDLRILSAVEAAVGREGLSHFTLLAAGGYGRREVFPHDDLDLVVLHDDVDGADALDPVARIELAAPGHGETLRRLLLDLREEGLRLRARVRSRSEHLALIARDVAVAAASLDSRELGGGPGPRPDPVPAVVEAIARGFAGGIEGFVGLIHEGLLARHEQFGGSAFMLEPQLGMGRGGLRDGHAIRWAARMRFGTEQLPTLARLGHVSRIDAAAFTVAFGFIERTLLALHALSRWRNDRLVFERQTDVARALGFAHGPDRAAASELMRAHHRQASLLAELAERWLHEWSIAATHHEAVPLAPGVELRGDLVAHAGPVPRTLEDAAAIVDAARHRRVAVHPATRTALRDLAPRLDPQSALSATARTLLRCAILEPEHDAATMRLLLDVDLFSRLVPEWAHLVGHNQNDVYHVFATDRHLFEAFRRVAGLDANRGEAPAFVVDAWRRVEQAGTHEVHALRLAALLHDVGKGLGGEPTLIGAGMIAEVGRRLGLDAQACEQARWLVLEHLRMTLVSQRRDISDPRTIAAFCRRLPSPQLLASLTVLSWADVASVSPQGASASSIELLQRLHDNAAALLGGRPARVAALRDHPDVDRALRPGSLRDEERAWLERELPDATWSSFDADDLRCATDMLLEVRSGRAPFRIDFDPERPGGRAVTGCCSTSPPPLRVTASASCTRASSPRDPAGYSTGLNSIGPIRVARRCRHAAATG